MAKSTKEASELFHNIMAASVIEKEKDKTITFKYFQEEVTFTLSSKQNKVGYITCTHPVFKKNFGIEKISIKAFNDFIKKTTDDDKVFFNQMLKAFPHIV